MYILGYKMRATRVNFTEKPGLTDRIKRIWGSGQSRGFKLGAWGVAIAAAVAMNQFQRGQSKEGK
jgi:hypothetical protein